MVIGDGGTADLHRSQRKIQRILIIPTDGRKGQKPGLASIYRALSKREKAKAIAQARADFAKLKADG